jgi:hypothetical protein
VWTHSVSGSSNSMLLVVTSGEQDSNAFACLI